MNKNILLTIGAVLSNITKTILVLVFFAITIFFIHFQLKPSSYADVKINIPEDASILKFEIEDRVRHKPVALEYVKLTHWITGSMVFTYFQYSLIFLLLYLSLHEFDVVLGSGKKLETFKQTNHLAFRKIGFYCIAITIISLVSSWQFGDYSKSSFSVSFRTLAFALFAFILSEIFKKGNQLMKENKLTI